MERNTRYFHLLERDMILAWRVASLSKWSAILLALAGLFSAVRQAWLIAGVSLFAGDLFHVLFGGSGVDSAAIAWVSMLYFIFKSVSVILPAVFLFRFGRALAFELNSGQEVMRMGRPLRELRNLLMVILIEAIIGFAWIF